MRWHRAGFRRYWRWKSRSLGGRPQIDADLRALIRRMSVDNPLWGAPRIHGELLKLGFEVAQSSIAKYMVKRCGPPAQGWRTFLRNHAPDIAAMDLFVAPTIGFDLLYVLVIIRLERRNLVWINVTPHPTAEWIARQVTEAFPWAEAPRYLIRDRDRVYGAAVTHRLRAMGIRDKPIAPGSPWQNGFAERLIGSIRRECTDQVARGLSPRECLCDLTCDPFRGRMGCDIHPDKFSALQSNDDEDIEQVKTNGRGNEQVDSGDVGRMAAQEGAPSKGGRSASLDHILRDAGLSDFKAELEQLAVDARGTPQRIVDAHPSD